MTSPAETQQETHATLSVHEQMASPNIPEQIAAWYLKPFWHYGDSNELDAHDPQVNFLLGYHARQSGDMQQAHTHMRVAAHQGINVVQILRDEPELLSDEETFQLNQDYESATFGNFGEAHFNAALSALDIAPPPPTEDPTKVKYGRPASKMQPRLFTQEEALEKAAGHLETATQWAIAENNLALLGRIETTLTAIPDSPKVDTDSPIQKFNDASNDTIERWKNLVQECGARIAQHRQVITAEMTAEYYEKLDEMP